MPVWSEPWPLWLLNPKRVTPIPLARKQQVLRKVNLSAVNVFRTLYTGKVCPSRADDHQERTRPLGAGLAVEWGPLLQAPQTGQRPQRRNTRNPLHTPQRQQQPPLGVSLLPPGHSASEHHDVSKLHVFAPTVPCLKWPSSRKSSRPTKPQRQLTTLPWGTKHRPRDTQTQPRPHLGSPNGALSQAEHPPGTPQTP